MKFRDAINDFDGTGDVDKCDMKAIFEDPFEEEKEYEKEHPDKLEASDDLITGGYSRDIVVLKGPDMINASISKDPATNKIVKKLMEKHK